jgi:hypothetical protein
MMIQAKPKQFLDLSDGAIAQDQIDNLLVISWGRL